MTISLISLQEAADIIEASQITRHDDNEASVRLDLLHPTFGRLTTIQAENEVYIIRHAPVAGVAQ
jgi:hypothetical protein